MADTLEIRTATELTAELRIRIRSLSANESEH